MNKTWLALLLTIAFAITQAGCSQQVKLDELQGTVIFDGKPVPYGSVEFFPDGSKQHQGPSGMAEVVDGKFSTKESGKGVLFGPHRVLVTGLSERPPVETDETKVSTVKPLFASYEVELDIQSTQLVIVVPGSATSKK